MEINKDNYDKLKKDKLTRAKIAEVFGIPEWKLKKLIAKEGWGRKVPKYVYNGCFSSLTEESAYWLGFLYADGCVDTRGRVRLMLQEGDVRHLEKFAAFTNSTEFTIQECNGYKRRAIEFTSREMCKDLEKYSIVPNKTLSTVIPDISVFGKYLRDFLRGLFDGDGTISESFSNVNSRTATLYTGFPISKPNMIWLDKVLSEVVNVTYKSYEKANIFTITLNTNKSVDLLHYMYANTAESCRLDRKYALYEDIVINGNRKTR